MAGSARGREGPMSDGDADRFAQIEERLTRIEARLTEQDEMFEEARAKFKEDVVMAKDREMASL